MKGRLGIFKSRFPKFFPVQSNNSNHNFCYGHALIFDSPMIMKLAWPDSLLHIFLLTSEANKAEVSSISILNLPASIPIPLLLELCGRVWKLCSHEKSMNYCI